MRFFVFVFCMVLVFSCKNTTDSNLEMNELDTSSLTLEGAWELVSYLNYREDGTIDTINSSNSNKQIKMYSPTKVMWSRLRTSDSLDWFGCGDYSVEDGILTEVLDYGSKSMNNIIKEKKEFSYKINLEENVFSQIQTDSLGHNIYAENYVRIE